MTGGPSPVAGANPFPLTYQTKQYDTTIPPRESPLDALANPPAAGIAAETSPDEVFEENTNPSSSGDTEAAEIASGTTT